jgi:hypothetical protein
LEQEQVLVILFERSDTLKASCVSPNAALLINPGTTRHGQPDDGEPHAWPGRQATQDALQLVRPDRAELNTPFVFSQRLCGFFPTALKSRNKPVFDLRFKLKEAVLFSQGPTTFSFLSHNAVPIPSASTPTAAC